MFHNNLSFHIFHEIHSSPSPEKWTRPDQLTILGLFLFWRKWAVGRSLSPMSQPEQRTSCPRWSLHQESWLFWLFLISSGSFHATIIKKIWSFRLQTSGNSEAIPYHYSHAMPVQLRIGPSSHVYYNFTTTCLLQKVLFTTEGLAS